MKKIYVIVSLFTIATLFRFYGRYYKLYILKYIY